MTWTDIKHFKAQEFSSPDQKDSGFFMDLDFVAKLDKVREIVGFPLEVHSGFRTPEHNAKVGGVDSSAHERGHAADLGARSSGAKFAIVAAAMQVGFSRIGIGNGFVHLDDDATKPQGVIWLYGPAEKR